MKKFFTIIALLISLCSTAQISHTTISIDSVNAPKLPKNHYDTVKVFGLVSNNYEAFDGVFKAIIHDVIYDSAYYWQKYHDPNQPTIGGGTTLMAGYFTTEIGHDRKHIEYLTGISKTHLPLLVWMILPIDAKTIKVIK
jgi:hypothetical protein